MRALVWTNEDGGDAGQISTLTLEDRGDTTRWSCTSSIRRAKPSRLVRVSVRRNAESFDQADELLAG